MKKISIGLAAGFVAACHVGQSNMLHKPEISGESIRIPYELSQSGICINKDFPWIGVNDISGLTETFTIENSQTRYPIRNGVIDPDWQQVGFYRRGYGEIEVQTYRSLFDSGNDIFIQFEYIPCRDAEKFIGNKVYIYSARL